MSSYGQQQQQSKPGFLKDYATVASRLEGFHEKYPDGRIITELVERQDDLISFKASVFTSIDSAEPSATGHSIDTLDLQKSSFEKLETAAVGRALAFLGFGAKNISSVEEIERHEGRQGQTTTQQRPSNVQQMPYGNEPKGAGDSNAKASTQQVARIRDLRKAQNITSPLDFNALTISSAENLINQLERG
jgi:hypothetical protein